MTLLLLLFLSSSPAPAPADEQPYPVVNPLDYKCAHSAGAYAPNSAYESNLRALAAALTANATASGFASGAAGAAPDGVYGLGLCRFDLTGVQCGTCLGAAFRDAPHYCQSCKDVAMYQDQCLVRFSDKDFLAGDGNSPEGLAWNMNNVTAAAAAARFDGLVGELMNATADHAAAARNGTRRYATGKAGFEEQGLTVYGLVQCTPDLSPAACRRCLAGIVGEMPRWFGGGREGGRILGVRCNLRYETYPFFAGDYMVTLHLSKASKIKVWIIIGAVCLVVLIASLLLLLLWMERRKRREKSKLKLQTYSMEMQKVLNIWKMEETNSEFSLFDFSQIADATDNFLEGNKLGQGGFGPVYKGQLPDGLEIAVKRLAACSGQGLLEFKNEIQLIAKLQHTNLVRLLGCCIQREEKMLVYEYMPNKSLDFFIFDPVKGALLNWPKRYHIIDGIAQGLLYLHKHSRLRVIHRDLKASNILLDSDMNSKISDFGMARIFGSNVTESNTTRVVGTHGYIAPEYVFEGVFSIKSDVFSFGVLVLEIISGKKTNSFYLYGKLYNLIAYAWQLWRDGRCHELIDPALGDGFEAAEIMRCAQVALLCVQESSDDRPTMSDVITMLSSDTSLSEPKQPAYFNVRAGSGEGSSNFNTGSCNISINITDVDCR